MIKNWNNRIFWSVGCIVTPPLFSLLSIHCRHLKQLGLGGEDSSFLRLTLGLAILAVGGIYAFRFFSNMRCSSLEKVEGYLLFPPDRPGGLIVGVNM